MQESKLNSRNETNLQVAEAKDVVVPEVTAMEPVKPDLHHHQGESASHAVQLITSKLTALSVVGLRLRIGGGLGPQQLSGTLLRASSARAKYRVSIIVLGTHLQFLV